MKPLPDEGNSEPRYTSWPLDKHFQPALIEPSVCKAKDDIGLFRKVRIITKSYITPNADPIGVAKCRSYRLVDFNWVNDGIGLCSTFMTRGTVKFH